ncbi:MAG: hypothetical protein NTU49_02305, partial [Gammaproteobacteria bacterium]|nr:hypothetical protein [Gammaproteobacteria bacterium]
SHNARTMVYIFDAIGHTSIDISYKKTMDQERDAKMVLLQILKFRNKIASSFPLGICLNFQN